MVIEHAVQNREYWRFIFRRFVEQTLNKAIPGFSEHGKRKPRLSPSVIFNGRRPPGKGGASVYRRARIPQALRLNHRPDMARMANRHYRVEARDLNRFGAI